MKECKFCHKRVEVEGEYTDIIYDLPNGIISVLGEDLLDIEVNYCPMCGRKLVPDVKED